METFIPAGVETTRVDMSPAGMPEVPWPKPLPLEGVKSRKRAIFSVPQAYFKSSSKQSMTTFSGLELTLESRVAVVGDKLCSSATDLLLGARQLVTGTLVRHDCLSVVHLGPELLDNIEHSVEQYLAAAAGALDKRPQVVILNEEAGARNANWSQACRYLLQHPAMKEFRGALVICAADEIPAIRKLCKHRWTGAGEWLWQENIGQNDGLEFVEDVLSVAGKEMMVEQFVQDVRTKSPFTEDSVEVAKANGWTLTVLTKQADVEAEQEDTSNGKRYAGFVCYTVRSGTFVIKRLAVDRASRKSGYGRHMMRFVLEKASQFPWIELMALDDAVSFYERFGFMDMTADDVDAHEHCQTLMEMPNTGNTSAVYVSMAPPLTCL